MGAEGWGEFESPIREVFVSDFLMDETPVTNKSFAFFVEQTGHVTTAESVGFAMGYVEGKMTKVNGLSWRTYAIEDRALHPVVLVSWADAMTYATWVGLDLPTEAEWEKAARGGLIQQLYPWGNYSPDARMCNFNRTTVDLPATNAVGSHAPNAFGLSDMAGNVWNWCKDWFDESYYAQGNHSDPQGPEAGTHKVRRGASFNIIQDFRLRCANRGAFAPADYAINVGFRCVKRFQHE